MQAVNPLYRFHYYKPCQLTASRVILTCATVAGFTVMLKDSGAMKRATTSILTRRRVVNAALLQPRRVVTNAPRVAHANMYRARSAPILPLYTILPC